MATILIAEDDAVSRELLGTYLSLAGHIVIEAQDGAQAIELIRLHRPDLALLDIQMPRQDGYTVLREIRSNPDISTRFVATTAYAMSGDCERALAAGFDAYITKPIRAAALQEVLRPLIAS